MKKFARILNVRIDQHDGICIIKLGGTWPLQRSQNFEIRFTPSSVAERKYNTFLRVERIHVDYCAVIIQASDARDKIIKSIVLKLW